MVEAIYHDPNGSALPGEGKNVVLGRPDDLFPVQSQVGGVQRSQQESLGTQRQFVPCGSLVRERARTVLSGSSIDSTASACYQRTLKVGLRVVAFRPRALSFRIARLG